MYVPPGSPLALVEAAHLTGRLLQAAAGAAGGGGGGVTAQGSAEVLSPGDVTRLHALYAASPGLDPAPLQHPRLVQQLLAGGRLRLCSWALGSWLACL